VPRPITRSQDRCLRSVGALNPHPAAVKDEIFAAATSSTAATSVQVRYEMVRRCAHRRPTHRRDSNALRRVPAPPTTSSVPSSSARAICGLLPKSAVQGWPQTTCRGRRGVAGGAHAGPAVDAASLVELVKRRFGVEIHARDDSTRAQKKTLVSERAPGVGARSKSSARGSLPEIAASRVPRARRIHGGVPACAAARNGLDRASAT